MNMFRRIVRHTKPRTVRFFSHLHLVNHKVNILNTQGKILVNRIQCKLCTDVIESKYTYDFKFCKCGACAIDGGTEYLRRLGPESSITELSVHGRDE